MRVLYIALIIISGARVFGQQDTSYLEYDQLRWSDINQSDVDQQVTKVVAGTRSEQALEDLPFSVFVITAEEIREQGYFTLVDAIKHLPGIRVSQPGSGLDGETFLMRGLYGNTYAKILINDIPIRPSVVGAMPIGSQLPIRQAERIEVIYGPAATIYGADAASGVINIILKDSEYPTYAQADIEMGDNNLIRLSALFGGKFAIGKKTLKLKMFGGFTSFNDRNVKYDLGNLYNPKVYERFFNTDTQQGLGYVDRPNYVGTPISPVLSNLPHQSSYAGFSAEIGAFELNVQRLFRTDHSSIGLNPYAVSYSDPQSIIGEEILSTSLTFKREFSNWNYNIRLSTLNYNINPLSSYKYVLPTFGVITNGYGLGFFGDVGIDQTIDIPRAVDSLYLSGPRYVTGDFFDSALEFQVNFKFNSNVNLAAGLQLNGGGGDAIERYEPVPRSAVFAEDILTVLRSPDATFGSGTAFVEGYFNYGTFYAVAGAQVFLRTDLLLRNDPVFNPRLGLLYKVNPKLSLRASYSSAFRYPSAFFTSSTYNITTKDAFIDVETGADDLEPEQTISLEAGLRYNPSKNISLDGSIYYTRTSNYINFNINRGAVFESLLLGYQNDSNSFIRMIGGQINLNIKNLWPAANMVADISLNYARGKERILSISLEELDARQLQDLPVIRAQPNFIGHVRMSFDVGSKIKIYLNHSFMTNSWTRNKLRITRAIANEREEDLQNDGYYLLDFRATIKISRQLTGYIDISNLTNAQYAGIDASFDPDILLYNPQSLRLLRFGFNFTFN